ncbi:MAG: hypothetical protein WC142_07600 [Bacteroidales bacterium]|jgi:hypothetical protein|nr:hypothetical protein [Bacteroidales bacterium]
MKKISVVIMIVWMSCSVFSQDLYIGFKSGFKQEVFSTKYDLYKTKVDFKTPTLALYYSMTFSNHFEIGWGIGYYAYSQNIKVHYEDFPFSKVVDCQTGHNVLFQTFSYRFQIGYHLRLAKDFSLKFNTGMHSELYYQKYDNLNPPKHIVGTSSPEVFIDYGYLWKGYNFLLSNSLSFQYYTKHNIGISVFAAYHAGLLPAFHNYITFEDDDYVVQDRIFTRGSYVEFGLEVGYRFKRISP